MRTGRPVAKIELSAEVAGILEGYTQRRKTAQALATALCRARPRRAARRAASGGAPQNRRWQGRKRHRPDIGEPTAGSHALEHAQHGPTLWHLDVERRADLACLRAAAAPPGDFQAVH